MHKLMESFVLQKDFLRGGVLKSCRLSSVAKPVPRLLTYQHHHLESTTARNTPHRTLTYCKWCSRCAIGISCSEKGWKALNCFNCGRKRCPASNPNFPEQPFSMAPKKTVLSFIRSMGIFPDNCENENEIGRVWGSRVCDFCFSWCICVRSSLDIRRCNSKVVRYQSSTSRYPWPLRFVCVLEIQSHA